MTMCFSTKSLLFRALKLPLNNDHQIPRPNRLAKISFQYDRIKVPPTYQWRREEWSGLSSAFLLASLGLLRRSPGGAIVFSRLALAGGTRLGRGSGIVIGSTILFLYLLSKLVDLLLDSTHGAFSWNISGGVFAPTVTECTGSHVFRQLFVVQLQLEIFELAQDAKEELSGGS